MASVALFGGPGGTDVGALAAGVDTIGIEWDRDACATRAAAGLPTIRADLLEYTPDALHVDRLDGLAASPPCPAFSVAGDGRGRQHIEAMAAALDTADPTGLGWTFPYLYGAAQAPIVSRDLMLLASPLQWIEELRPRWVLLEQVPPVLPFWQAAARWLQRLGYHAWAGILCAADYGVPQQRYRAILMASTDHPVAAPDPTHAEHPQPTLWGQCPEPWITFAEAVGMAGTLHTNVDQRDDGTRQTRSADRATPTLTTRSVGQWILDPLDRPAATVTGSSVNNWIYRRPATTVQGDARIWPPGHKINQDDIDRLGEAEAVERYGDRAGTDAIRVTVADAAALQSFPPDYPFQGTKASQAQQVGNAVPPLLAYHLVKELAA